MVEFGGLGATGNQAHASQGLGLAVSTLAVWHAAAVAAAPEESCAAAAAAASLVCGSVTLLLVCLCSLLRRLLPASMHVYVAAALPHKHMRAHMAICCCCRCFGVPVQLTEAVAANQHAYMFHWLNGTHIIIPH